MQNDFPMLSLKERDRRWQMIRKDMEELGLDCLVIQGDQGYWGYNDSNTRYVTGLGDFSYALFPLKEEPISFVWWTAPYQSRRSKEDSPLTAAIRSKVKKEPRKRNPWALEQPWVRNVRQGWPRPSEPIAKAIKELGLEKGNICLVSTFHLWEPEGTMPYVFVKNLQAALPSAMPILLKTKRLLSKKQGFGRARKKSDVLRKLVKLLIMA
jgi:hypothetical protein